MRKATAKSLSWLISLAMILSMMTVAMVPVWAEEEPADPFSGKWVETIAHRATIEIAKTDEGYTIHAEWPGSAFERAYWDIPGATFDKEKDALVYNNGKQVKRTYKEDGSYEEETVSATESGTISIKDGKLTWHRDADGAEDAVFEKEIIVVPDYSGDWVETIAHRAVINIKAEGEGYTIHVEWPGSASSRAIWDITNAVYDKEKKALLYANGKEIERTYKEDGTYEDKLVSATASGAITLKEDGNLIWHRDGVTEDSTFEKTEIVEPQFAGDWVGVLHKRARMNVKKTGENYYVRVEWAGSANSKAIWDIPKASIDPEKGCLVYSNCTEFDRVFKEDGTYQDTVHTTQASGTLTLKDDGKLYWHRNDSPQDDIVFERSDNPFVDVEESDYFFDAVLWAYKNGITTGMSDTEFSPNGNLTRGQVVTFLWRAAGKPAPTKTENPFTDVSKDMYCYEPVLWAVEKGITTGMDETHFSPDGVVTRAQSVTFLFRYMGAKTDAPNPFVDVPAGSYYYDAVLWASANKIVNGMDATHFAPEGGCTRGQIVTILYRAK